ncbi:MAG: glycosyltransferase family 4 protein [Pseudomonadota bacterium]
MKKILIVTSQPLPEDGKPATGGAIRAWALGEALKRCGHRVYYSIPLKCCNPDGGVDDPRRDFAHNVKDLDIVVTKTSADIVLFCNWGLAIEALECSVPVAIDMNGSLVLENYYRNRGKLLEDSLAKIEAVAKADFLIAGSESQKNYLTSWCLLAGVKPENIAIGVVPFSLSPDVPRHDSFLPLRFILAGYDWPWLNGGDSIRTVCNELEKSEKGTLHVYSSASPYVDVFAGEDSSADAQGQAQAVGSKCLVKHDPVDFTTLTKALCRASVAVDLWQRNPERELAVPSRSVAYLWAGLPVITSDYGELAKLIGQYQAGWVIEENNYSQLRQVIEQITRMGAEELSVYRANARRLFADRFMWDKTIEPLDRFCRIPRFNRASSSLSTRYFYYQQLSENLQHLLLQRERYMEDQKKKVDCIEVEKELMWRVQRKPRGLALLHNPQRLVQSLRRTMLGIPLLGYLTFLTLAGHCLHLLQERLGRR